ncbi:MAG: DUF4921 family protein [Halobacteriota archaeon]|nr:DUF4921 family protein [Halobacteriota archaeon]
MTELRKHYFLDEYSLIAIERSRRPSDFKCEREELPGENCPFCPGNEEMTPPAQCFCKDAWMIEDTSEKIIRSWDVRCFPNLYPALSPDSHDVIDDHWDKRRGFGFHEVIVETPCHNRHPAELSDEEIRLLFKVYTDRVAYYYSKEGIKFVSLFRNFGKDAGASLSHPHTQIICVPLTPPKFKRELSVINSKEVCPYCDVVTSETGSERFIAGDDDWIAFAPFASRSPFEIWILPKEHTSNITELEEDKLFSLGLMMRDMLQRLNRLLDFPHYNYIFFQLDEKRYHLNIRIKPKVTIPAGFEMSTDIFINTVSPENAAKYLREV